MMFGVFLIYSEHATSVCIALISWKAHLAFYEFGSFLLCHEHVKSVCILFLYWEAPLALYMCLGILLIVMCVSVVCLVVFFCFVRVVFPPYVGFSLFYYVFVSCVVVLRVSSYLLRFNVVLLT